MKGGLFSRARACAVPPPNSCCYPRYCHPTAGGADRHPSEHDLHDGHPRGAPHPCIFVLSGGGLEVQFDGICPAYNPSTDYMTTSADTSCSSACATNRARGPHHKNIPHGWMGGTPHDLYACAWSRRAPMHPPDASCITRCTAPLATTPAHRSTTHCAHPHTLTGTVYCQPPRRNAR